MLARIRKTQEEHEGGFTLIELLVVIIIIGILAAIAIPTFLKQREKGYKADMKSSLKNGATAVESYATENGGSYSPGTPAVDVALTDMTAEGFRSSASVTVAVVGGFTDVDEFCLSAVDSRLPGTTFYYDSDVGAPGSAACTSN